MIDTRLARLGETAQQVLTVASVVGREFRLELLEALIDEPVERIISALEEASAAGLVREVADDVDRFVFPHALVRETLYERQSAQPPRAPAPPDRAGAGGARPRSARRPPSSPTTSSRAATSTATGKAIGYAVQAAEQADGGARLRGGRRALPARARARCEPATERRRCELLLALGGAEARAGDPARAATFARAAALARGQAPRAARPGGAGRPPALRRRAARSTGRRSRCSRRRSRRSGTRARCRAAAGAAGQPAALRGRAERVDGAQRPRASSWRTRIDDPPALVARAREPPRGAAVIEHLDERLRLSEELLALAERIGERELEALGAHWRVYDLLEAADADGARAASERIAEQAARIAPARVLVPGQPLGADLDDGRRPRQRGRAADHAHARVRDPCVPARGRRGGDGPAAGDRLPPPGDGRLRAQPRRRGSSRTRTCASSSPRSRSRTCRPATARRPPRSSRAWATPRLPARHPVVQRRLPAGRGLRAARGRRARGRAAPDPAAVPAPQRDRRHGLVLRLLRALPRPARGRAAERTRPPRRISRRRSRPTRPRASSRWSDDPRRPDRAARGPRRARRAEALRGEAPDLAPTEQVLPNPKP